MTFHISIYRVKQRAADEASRGKFSKAAESYEEAASLYHAEGDLLEEGICHLDHSRVLFDHKRYGDALNALAEAERVFLEAGGTTGLSNWVVCRMERGFCLNSLARYPEALRALLKARRALRSNYMHEELPRCEMALAWAKRDYGIESDNIVLVGKALDDLSRLRRSFVTGSDSSGVVQCDISTGYGLVALGRYSEASDVYARGAEVASECGHWVQWKDCRDGVKSAKRFLKKSQKARR